MTIQTDSLKSAKLTAFKNVVDFFVKNEGVTLEEGTQAALTFLGITTLFDKPETVQATLVNNVQIPPKFNLSSIIGAI